MSTLSEVLAEELRWSIDHHIMSSPVHTTDDGRRMMRLGHNDLLFGWVTTKLEISEEQYQEMLRYQSGGVVG
jgi:hypothetical protein